MWHPLDGIQISLCMDLLVTFYGNGKDLNRAAGVALWSSGLLGRAMTHCSSGAQFDACPVEGMISRLALVSSPLGHDFNPCHHSPLYAPQQSTSALDN